MVKYRIAKTGLVITGRAKIAGVKGSSKWTCLNKILVLIVEQGSTGWPYQEILLLMALFIAIRCTKLSAWASQVTWHLSTNHYCRAAIVFMQHKKYIHSVSDSLGFYTDYDLTITYIVCFLTFFSFECVPV